MCGLTGILCHAAGDVATTRGVLERMNAQIRHRGPDAGDTWIEGPVALGHRRLSILDLSPAGAQPMVSRSGRYVVVYNGEIYNHLEMRRVLEAEGAAADWKGHSDTETLLAAIERHGLDEALARTAGMFALALWDRQENRLSLARDRMGEKPLYWGWAGRALVFGSELKALAAHPDFDRTPDRAAVGQYLRFSYIPAPRSIHRDAFKLEPGCILEVSGRPPAQRPDVPLRPGDRTGTLSIRRYWSLDAVVTQGAADPITDPVEALGALERTLGTAVRRQLISDVPLGAFLSGGVDSSLIVALMQAQGTQKVRTFTVGFEHPEYDESEHAAAVARHLGTDHHALRVTDQDARDVVPGLPVMYDEPFADPSQLPTHLVCRAARGQVTVALSGDAGDELFSGYNRYLWGPRIWPRIAPLPVPLRRLLGGAITSLPLPVLDRLGRLYSRSAEAAAGVALFGIKAHRIGDSLRAAQSQDAFYQHLVSIWDAPGALVPGLGQEASALIDDPVPPALDGDFAARMAFQDMRSYLPDDILCKVDRAAMAISLETRAPFLDPEVVALSARIPTALKIRGAVGKWPLRELLYTHVPPSLIERPKVGFSMPIADWLRGPLRGWAEDLLSEDQLRRDGLLDPTVVRTIWTEHMHGRRDRSVRLWNVLMLQAWLAR